MSDDLRQEILKKVEEYYLQSHIKKLTAGTSKIPPSGKVYSQDEMINLVDSSLDFWLTEGRYNEKFEARLAETVGTKYCVTTNSGSSANLLAFSVLTSDELGEKKINPGDEVIEVGACFPTTLTPVIQNRCIPVFVDSQLGTYNPSFESVKSAVTDKTKAVFLAHTLGNPFEVEEIAEFCKSKGIWLIEDCCDALGAKYNGKNVGTFGDISTLSFYPAHHITTGEGGAIFTSSPVLNKLIRSFRDWGRDCWCAPGADNTCKMRYDWKFQGIPDGYDHKYIYSHIGYNLKMTDMQAAVGLAQLDKLAGFIEKRRSNHDYLNKRFNDFSKYFIFPYALKNAEPSWFGYVLTIKEDVPFTRKELLMYLDDQKIGSRLLFAGNVTRQPAFKNCEYRLSEELKVSDFIMSNTFWIGCYPAIDTSVIDYMYSVFKNFLDKYE